MMHVQPRRGLVQSAVAVIAGAWAGAATAASLPHPAAESAPPVDEPDHGAADWLGEVAPVALHENLRQVVVQDGGFPGVTAGDVMLVVPRLRFTAAAPGVTIWQGDRCPATPRTIDRTEFSAAVLGQVAGWFHTHSAAALREGR